MMKYHEAFYCRHTALNITCSEVKKNLNLKHWFSYLTLLLLNTTCPVLANSVDPDQLASEEANWSGSALFVIQHVNFYQKPGSSNLIGWETRSGRGILIYSAW